MEPTPQEVDWAVALKRAIEEDADIPDKEQLSDLEIIQNAIIAKGNVEKALRRIHRLLHFKEKYGIVSDGSYEQGLRDVLAFQQTIPDFTLGCQTEKTSGQQILSFDFSRYQVRKINSEEAVAICMRAFFYALQCCSVDLAMIRHGVRILGDYGGLRWENFSVKAEQRAAELYSNCYPMRMTEMVMMDTNPLIRVFYGVLKLFMSKKIAQTFRFPPSRDDFLLKQGKYHLDAIPECWGGRHSRKDLSENFKQRLKERYMNREYFRLPEQPSPEK